MSTAAFVDYLNTGMSFYAGLTRAQLDEHIACIREVQKSATDVETNERYDELIHNLTIMDGIDQQPGKVNPLHFPHPEAGVKSLPVGQAQSEQPTEEAEFDTASLLDYVNKPNERRLFVGDEARLAMKRACIKEHLFIRLGNLLEDMFEQGRAVWSHHVPNLESQPGRTTFFGFQKVEGLHAAILGSGNLVIVAEVFIEDCASGNYLRVGKMALSVDESSGRIVGVIENWDLEDKPIAVEEDFPMSDAALNIMAYLIPEHNDVGLKNSSNMGEAQVGEECLTDFRLVNIIDGAPLANNTRWVTFVEDPTRTDPELQVWFADAVGGVDARKMVKPIGVKHFKIEELFQACVVMRDYLVSNQLPAEGEYRKL